MINILLPMAGKSRFFNSDDYPFPLPLIEINNKLMIEMVLKNLDGLSEKVNFIFVVNETDCLKYHLDNTLNILTQYTCDIIRIKSETKGSLCSALLAIDKINNDLPLVISNSDQIINEKLEKIISFFQINNADAGAICFESVHPRWSFARISEKFQILETAEKRPLSKNAIAGFYYFKHGKYFVSAGMQSIRKESCVNGNYYIAPVLNELILENKNMLAYIINNSNYHTFYSPQKIEEYKRSIENSSMKPEP
jgi:NDP-sugar pyrophosphorylase family protein